MLRPACPLDQTATPPDPPEDDNDDAWDEPDIERASPQPWDDLDLDLEDEPDPEPDDFWIDPDEQQDPWN